MRRPTKAEFRAGLIAIALMVALFIAFAALSGCTVGRSLDTDEPMLGVALGDERVGDAAGAIGGVLGGIFGGPAGAAAGTALFGGIATLLWGSRQKSEGRHVGWEEATGKPAGAAPVGAGPAAPSPVPPVA